MVVRVKVWSNTSKMFHYRRWSPGGLKTLIREMTTEAALTNVRVRRVVVDRQRTARTSTTIHEVKISHCNHFINSVFCPSKLNLLLGNILIKRTFCSLTIASRNTYIQW